MKRYCTTLIIAGSDSCGGAGIQADIKTCSALGVYAATAITAVTAQNTTGVRDIQPILPHVVRGQIEAVLDDLCVDAIKIGMLCNAPIADTVADLLQQVHIPIILDPVMVATSGAKLISDEAIEIISQKLFPICDVITPNVFEATLLSGIEITNHSDVEHAAHILMAKGCRAVLIKGGHLEGSMAVDTLYVGDTSYSYSSPIIHSDNTHGTGCTLASAIAAYRAEGYALPEAVERAKAYVSQAIACGAGIVAGKGHGAVNHGFAPEILKTRHL